MAEKIESHVLLNATDFGLKHFYLTQTERSIFFICITQEPKLLTGEVKSIKEAYEYFNQNFGNKAQPPVKIKQQWGLATIDITHAESPDPNDPGKPSISEVRGKMRIKEIPSSYSELILFIKRLFKPLKEGWRQPQKSDR